MNSWSFAIVFVLAVFMRIESTYAICAPGQFSTLQELPCTEPTILPSTNLQCSQFATGYRSACASWGVCDQCKCSCDPSFGADGGCPARVIQYAEVCTTCPGNHSGDGLTCTVCATGSISTNPKSNTCLSPCAAGSTLTNGVCIACAVGKYKPIIGWSACLDVPAHGFASNNALVCNAGFEVSSGTQCDACTSGKYTTGTGVPCVNLPANSFALDTRSFFCNADYFANATTCQACPSKSRSPAGSTNSSACHCKWGYSDVDGGASNCQPPASHELALCANLANATAHVLALDADQHSVASLLETGCVYIDPCTQVTRAGLPAAAGAWHHVSALGLTSTGDGAHYNHHAFEYARVPQGVVVETCPPDFAYYKTTGTWRCDANPDTHVRIAGACPSAAPHTILDCLAPAQFDAGSEFKQVNPE